ncbi:MAG: DUF4097 family beta strand repeat protein, partial [Chloroflexi bacterium]|nr:DUF4097 family beta strand repeat protein [Chloroflexota bacterium]
LVAPINAGQTLTVSNPSGATTVRVGADPSTVHVVATRHFSVGGRGPTVTLTPSADGVSLQSSSPGGGFFQFAGASSVDYAIEVPAAIAVRAQSSSGDTDIDGVTGNVAVSATSGSVTLANLTGAVTVNTSSGQIRASHLQHLTEAGSSSGSIHVDGAFTDAATIRSSSGSVDLVLSPGSAVQLNVQTNSGSISTGNLPLSGVNQQRNSLQATLGSPAPSATLDIQTSSGSVRLSS